MRLDKYLVEECSVRSRARAAELIRTGKVECDGETVLKQSFDVPDGAVVVVKEEPFPSVGRGALKLLHALDEFRFSPDGLVCLDIGASTGGFTDVLLRQNVAKVYAVDSGHGQLSASLKDDPRVVNLEGFNAKELSPDTLGVTVDLAVCDVSFISQTLLHAPVRSVLRDRGAFIGLVKPQFELSRKEISKGGIVKDADYRFNAAERVYLSLIDNGFSVKGFCVSPIEGGDGNVEFLIFAVVSDDTSAVTLSDVERIVYENRDLTEKRQ